MSGLVSWIKLFLPIDSFVEYYGLQVPPVIYEILFSSDLWMEFLFLRDLLMTYNYDDFGLDNANAQIIPNGRRSFIYGKVMNG